MEPFDQDLYEELTSPTSALREDQARARAPVTQPEPEPEKPRRRTAGIDPFSMGLKLTQGIISGYQEGVRDRALSRGFEGLPDLGLVRVEGEEGPVELAEPTKRRIAAEESAKAAQAFKPKPEAYERMMERVDQGDLGGLLREVVADPAGTIGFMGAESLARFPDAQFISAIPRAGTYVASFESEKRADIAGSITELVQERGGDPKNPDDVYDLLSDKEALGEISRRASKGAAALAATETAVESLAMAVTGGWGAFAPGFITRPLTKTLVRFGSEVVGESLGEGAAQLAKGEDLNVPLMLVEGIAASGQSVATVAGQELLDRGEAARAEPEPTEEPMPAAAGIDLTRKVDQILTNHPFQTKPIETARDSEFKSFQRQVWSTVREAERQGAITPERREQLDQQLEQAEQAWFAGDRGRANTFASGTLNTVGKSMRARSYSQMMEGMPAEEQEEFLGEVAQEDPETAEIVREQLGGEEVPDEITYERWKDEYAMEAQRSGIDITDLPEEAIREAFDEGQDPRLAAQNAELIYGEILEPEEQEDTSTIDETSGEWTEMVKRAKWTPWEGNNWFLEFQGEDIRRLSEHAQTGWDVGVLVHIRERDGKFHVRLQEGRSPTLATFDTLEEAKRAAEEGAAQGFPLEGETGQQLERLSDTIDLAHAHSVRRKDLQTVRDSEFKAYLNLVKRVAGNAGFDPIGIPPEEGLEGLREAQDLWDQGKRAEALQRAEGVIAFYHDFVSDPRDPNRRRWLLNRLRDEDIDELLEGGEEPPQAQGFRLPEGFELNYQPGVVTVNNPEGDEVGEVIFREEGDRIVIEAVNVSPEHRRQGVASAMYRRILGETGIDQITSEFRTPEGEAFREGLEEQTGIEKIPSLADDETPVWWDKFALPRGTPSVFIDIHSGIPVGRGGMDQHGNVLDEIAEMTEALGDDPLDTSHRFKVARDEGLIYVAHLGGDDAPYFIATVYPGMEAQAVTSARRHMQDMGWTEGKLEIARLATNQFDEFYPELKEAIELSIGPEDNPFQTPPDQQPTPPDPSEFRAGGIRGPEDQEGEARPDPEGEREQEIDQQAKWVPPPSDEELANYTGMSRMVVTRARRLLGLDDLPPPQRRGWQTDMRIALERGVPENAADIALGVIANPRPIRSWEVAGMLIRKAQLEETHDQEMTKADNLLTLGRTKEAQRHKELADAALNEYDIIDRGRQVVGEESARSTAILGAGLERPEMTLINMRRRARVRKGRPLNPKEEEQIRKTHERLKKTEKALKDAIARADRSEQQVLEDLAKKVALANKPKEKPTGERLDEIKAEREAIKKQIRELGYRANNALGASAELTYLAGKLAVNYMKEGLVHFDSLVNKVMSDLPDLTREQAVEAIASAHPDIQQEQVETATRELEDVQQQQEMLDEFNKLDPEEQKKILNTLQTKAQSQETSNDRILKIEAQIQKLRERLANVEAREPELGPQRSRREVELLEELRELRTLLRYEQKTADLMRQIESGVFHEPIKRRRPASSPEIRQAKIQYMRAKAEVRKITQGTAEYEGVWDRFVDIPRTMRELMVTGEISAAFRQGLNLFLAKPTAFPNAYIQALKGAVFQDHADHIAIMIQEDPNHPIRQEAGLTLTFTEGFNEREEVFMSKALQRIPAMRELWESDNSTLKKLGLTAPATVKSVINASERHWVTYLNLLRISIFDEYIDQNPGAAQDMETLERLAKTINAWSGRGNVDLGTGPKSISNVIFFAPKYAISRFEALPRTAAMLKDPKLRGLAAGHLTRMALWGGAWFGLASLAGLQIGWDPRDSDFGKIIWGNTRIDIWGGMQQPFSLVMRTGLAAIEARDEDFEGRKLDAYDLLQNFSTYKLGPTFTLPYQLATKKDVVGNDVSELEAIANHSLPLFQQDVKETWAAGGPLKGVAAAAGVAHGFSISTYGNQLKAGDVKPILDRARYSPRLTFPQDEDFDKETKERLEATFEALVANKMRSNKELLKVTKDRGRLKTILQGYAKESREQMADFMFPEVPEQSLERLEQQPGLPTP